MEKNCCLVQKGDNKKVKVYYTDERINKLKRIKDKDEIKEIIKNSYLMCQN